MSLLVTECSIQMNVSAKMYLNVFKQNERPNPSTSDVH